MCMRPSVFRGSLLIALELTMSMYTYLTSPRTGAVGGRTVEYRLGAPVEAEPRSFSSVTVKHETP